MKSEAEETGAITPEESQELNQFILDKLESSMNQNENESSAALIDVIERLEPFDRDIRHRILKAAKVFLVD